MNSETESSPKSNNPATKSKKGKSGLERWSKVLLPTILFLIIIPISILILSQEKGKKVVETGEDQNADYPVILYYSNKCPHCKDLEEWVGENDIQAKAAFSQKEVGENRQNAEDLMKRAAVCGISEDEIGVPFLWDGNARKCFMGYDKIIAYFQQRISAGKTSADLEDRQTAQNNASLENKNK